MGGNQNPINEATDDDAPPLVDGSTSGLLKSIVFYKQKAAF